MGRASRRARTAGTLTPAALVARHVGEVTPGALVRACAEGAESLDTVVLRLRDAGREVPDAVLAAARAGLADDVLRRHLRERPCHPPTSCGRRGNWVWTRLRRSTGTGGSASRPPGPFPAETESHDPDILAPPPDVETLGRSPLRPGRPVLYAHLLTVVRHKGLAPALVASRMRAYGLSVPEPPRRPPRSWTTTRFPARWTGQGLRADAPVPYARVLAAAPELMIPPMETAARLAEHGFPLSCQEPPEGLSPARALDLVGETRRPNRSPVRLYGLLRGARALGAPLTRVHHWLVAPGIDVVDPAEAVRAALPLIPRARALALDEQ